MPPFALFQNSVLVFMRYVVDGISLYAVSCFLVVMVNWLSENRVVLCESHVVGQVPYLTPGLCMGCMGLLALNYIHLHFWRNFISLYQHVSSSNILFIF